MSSGKKLFSYKWLIAGVSTLVMLSSYGTELSFGVFLKPILNEFGWTRAMFSGALATVEGVAGLVGILMGRLVDKYGARMLIAAGTLFGVLGYLLLSRAGSVWEFYVYFGLFEGICVSTCWVPVVATVSRWFVEKRSLAIGIVTSGSTAGTMFLPPLAAHLITLSGWRITYIMMGIIVLIAALPAIIVLGKNPSQYERMPDYKRNRVGDAGFETGERISLREWSALQAMKTMPFWMLMITGLVTSAGFYFLTVHIIAYATDIGIAATSAALILTIMGGSNILGKLLAWIIAVKMGSRFTLLILIALQAFCLFLLIQAKSLCMLFILGLVLGFGFGGAAPIRMTMVCEFFGMRSIGVIIGLLGVAWAMGGIAGPVLAGYIFDLNRNYDMAFFAGGLIMTIGVISTLFLKSPGGDPVNGRDC